VIRIKCDWCPALLNHDEQQRYVVGPCEHCGHVNFVFHSPELGCWVVLRADRCMMDTLSPQDKKDVREYQEKAHHANGHWG
jgi:phage FluMu protein Com